MTKRRVKLEAIMNARRRNSARRTRTEGVLKSARELATLCTVGVNLVIHHKEENNVTLWPSPEAVAESHGRFMALSHEVREKKMVTNEKFLEGRLDKETNGLLKIQSTVDPKQSQQLIHELLQGESTENGFDMFQLNTLQSFVAEKLKKLEKRAEELNN